MSELAPIDDPAFWRKSLRDVGSGHRFHAIFKCPLDRWLRVEAKHREILARLVKPEDKILDVGCGWGRLLTLLPKDRTGAYIGVDICPDFIALAKQDWPNHHFVCGNIVDWERSWGLDDAIRMDWSILISIKKMVIKNMGDEAWNKMERELRTVSKKILFLEYDENAEGEVVLCK